MNGECSENITQCLCPKTNQFRCFNGSCVSDSSQCETSPSFEKVVPYQQTIDNSKSQTLFIQSDDQSILCTVTIPAGAFGSSDLSLIGVDSVSDSQLRRILYNGVQNPPILSSVIQLEILSEGVPAIFLHPIEITCVIRDSNQSLCLGFVRPVNGSFDGQSWKCLDSASYVNSSEGSFMLTGTTTHFTSFGVLLEEPDSGDNEGSSGNGGGLSGKTTGIVLGVIGSVVVVGIVIAVIVLELYRRKTKRMEFQSMNIQMEESRTQSSINPIISKEEH